MTFLRPGVAAAFLFLLAATSSPARLSMDVSAGFDGKATPQSWMPVLVEFFNDGPPIEGWVEVHTPPPSRDPVYAKPVVLPTNSRKRAWLYPRTGAYTTQFDVRLVSTGGRVIAEAAAPLQIVPVNTGLAVLATRSEIRLPSFPLSNNEGQPAVVARVLPVSLPDDATGLEGTRTIVLSNTNESEWTPGQRKALRDWVALGGHLVVSIDNADNFIHSRFWEELLPMQVTGSEVAPDLSEIQKLGVNPIALARSEVPIAVGALQRGVTRAGVGNRPLIVESTFGRGVITLLTFDIAREPFRGWGGQPAFWQALLDRQATERSPDGKPTVQWGGRNYDDVFRMLLEARLERRISLWWLIGLIGCYLVVIGPFDYWLVHRKLKRPVLTWITFPCYVVGFSALIYGIGYALKSGDSELTQVSIVDVLPEVSLTRGVTVSGFYSTSNRRYAFHGTVPESHFRLTSGGMGGPAGGVTLGSDTRMVETERGGSMTLPVPIWSSRTFVTEWLGGDLPIEVKRTLTNGAAGLELVNHLPAKLTRVCVVTKDQLHRLPDVNPGSTSACAIGTGPTESLAEATGAVRAFLSHNLPMMGFGFRSIPVANVPPWEDVLLGACFPDQWNDPKQPMKVVAWRGMDLSESARNGDVIVLAYVGDYPIPDSQPQFQPDRVQRVALLRCVLSQPSNPEP